MPDKPRRIDLSPGDLKAFLERIKPVVSDQDYEAIKAMGETAHRPIPVQKRWLSATKASNMVIPVRNASMERFIGAKFPKPWFESWVHPLYREPSMKWRSFDVTSVV